MKYLLLLLLLGFTAICRAQIGINTDTPVAGSLIQINTGNLSNNRDQISISKTTGNLGTGLTNPQYKLDINTGGSTSSPIPGIRIIDGKQKNDYMLMSDANGKAIWSEYKSTYNLIPSFTKSFTTTNGTIYYDTGLSFQLNQKGTYLITLGVMITPSNGVNLLGSSALQLKPTNVPNDWGNSTKRFKGAYEVYPVHEHLSNWRYYINQAITSTIDNQTVYLMLWSQEAVNGTYTIVAGETGKQTSGGSYLRIN